MYQAEVTPNAKTLRQKHCKCEELEEGQNDQAIVNKTEHGEDKVRFCGFLGHSKNLECILNAPEGHLRIFKEGCNNLIYDFKMFCSYMENK